MSDTEKLGDITVTGEWQTFAAGFPRILTDAYSASMWAAGFASALHVVKAVGNKSSTPGEFGEHMERLLAEAERAIQAGRATQ